MATLCDSYKVGIFLIPYLLDNSAETSTLTFPTIAVSEKSWETSSIIGPINFYPSIKSENIYIPSNNLTIFDINHKTSIATTLLGNEVGAVCKVGNLDNFIEVIEIF